MTKTAAIPQAGSERAAAWEQSSPSNKKQFDFWKLKNESIALPQTSKMREPKKLDAEARAQAMTLRINTLSCRAHFAARRAEHMAEAQRLAEASSKARRLQQKQEEQQPDKIQKQDPTLPQRSKRHQDIIQNQPQFEQNQGTQVTLAFCAHTAG